MGTHHDAFESFCLALNLEWGNPKGLGPARQRRSTQVGGKKAMPLPIEDLTASDLIRVAGLARAAGIMGINDEEETRKLYARYVTWYEDQQSLRRAARPVGNAP